MMGEIERINESSEIIFSIMLISERLYLGAVAVQPYDAFAFSLG